MNLKVIDFINANQNWEELLKSPPYSLHVNRKDCFVSFNYNQIDSDLKIDLVKECRGLILEDKTFKVVCCPFFKFFNYGEGQAAKIDWSTARIQEKVDGCCDENTILITEKGKKTIKDICKNNRIAEIHLKSKWRQFLKNISLLQFIKKIQWLSIIILGKEKIKQILNYNIENEKIEFDEIIDFSIKKNNNDWYEIELENGNKIKLTSNHLVWLPNEKIYKKVKELTTNDVVLYENLRIL